MSAKQQENELQVVENSSWNYHALGTIAFMLGVYFLIGVTGWLLYHWSTVHSDKGITDMFLENFVKFFNIFP